MFGDHTENEPDEPAPLVQGRIADRFLQSRPRPRSLRVPAY
jgi:hypothetical protein